jgi:sodium-dependent dicarboxylate transporter 2/3/5
VLDVPPDVPGGSTRAAERVFNQFASETLFLLIGSFMIAQAMLKYDLSRRIALGVLSLPGVARSTWRVVASFGALGMLLAGVMDNGSVAAMLLPIALGLNTALSDRIRATDPASMARSQLRFGTALMLMTAYAPTVGSLLTPIGDPTNLVARRIIEQQLGVRISFTDWTLIAAPIVLVLFGVLCVLLLTLYRPEVVRIPGARRWVHSELASLGPMSRGEKNTVIVFTTVVLMWMTPSLVSLVAGRESGARAFIGDRMPASVAAILAATLLFLLPVNWKERRFTLTWAEATRIDWGTVLLVGTGLTLGGLMTSTGLAELIGRELASSVGGTSDLLIYLLIAVTGVLLSEAASNLAAVGILVPIVPALVASVGGDALTAMLLATFATRYGFMLPISTSANAIVYGSGAVSITAMIRAGAVVDVIGVGLIVLMVPLMTGLVGLP